jgi:small subunit ribosomal protein S8e
MSVSHGKGNRLKSGAKRRALREKIKAELGSEPVNVTMGAAKRENVRTLGGNAKQRLRTIDFANVVDPSTGKWAKSKILTVVENKANRHFVRMNIITRGAIVKTELGNALVTSRPGQDGTVNAVLVKA